LSISEFGGVGFDTVHIVLQLSIKGDTIGTDYQLMQFLAMASLNNQAGIYILVYEMVVENYQVT